MSKKIKHKILLDFEIQTDHRIPARRSVLINKKKTCHIVDFAISAYNRVKIKGEKIDKYLNPARELKRKTWSMWVTVIPIVIGALKTVSNGLEQLEIKGRIQTIQTTALLG